MEKIELKKIFNKHIFRDKSFIKMVCFTIVLLLVLILGSNFGYVSADEIAQEEEEITFNYGSFSGTHSFNYSDYCNSSIYDSSVDSFPNTSTEIEVKFINFLNTYSIPQSGYYMNNVGGNDRDMDMLSGDFYYVCFGELNDFDLFLVDSACFVVGGYVYLPYDDASWVYHIRFQYNSSTDTFEPRYINGHDKDCQLLVDWNNQVEHSTGFSYFSLDTYYSLCFATCPIYFSANNTGYGISDIANFLNSGGNDFKDVNYFLYDSSFGYETGYGGTAGEGVGNNMYVDYADWILNNYVGDVPDNYRNMSVSFTSNLNDYIHEHYDDLEEQGDAYCIWLDYSVFVDFYYDGVVDYGTVSATLGGEFANVQYSHDITTTNTYHWSCNYVFTPTDNDADYISSGYLLPMDAFIEDYNQIYTMGLSGLFAYLSPSDGSGNMISSSGTRVHTNLTLVQLMQLISEDGIIWDSNYEGLNQFKMTCTAKIIYDDGTTYAPSGTYIETFNLLDGTSTVDSSNMLTNYNPYITNTDEDVTSSLPSTSTSGSSVATSSTGNVTQTVNVTNEGAKYIPSIINSLIPSSFGDTTTGLAQRFTTLVDSNNFITVMANTVPAIPSAVWTYLVEYLGISLYLLACAFVLRLILDLL